MVNVRGSGIRGTGFFDLMEGTSKVFSPYSKTLSPYVQILRIN